MKHVRQTLAALVVIALATLLAYGMKASPLNGLFADGGRDRGRDGRPPAGAGPQRGHHRHLRKASA
jgi:hypothetical protein